MNSKLIPRSEWEAYLRSEGCRPCEGDDRYIGTGELWIASTGHLFPVPDADGNMLFDEQVQVAFTIRKLRERRHEMKSRKK